MRWCCRPSGRQRRQRPRGRRSRQQLPGQLPWQPGRPAQLCRQPQLRSQGTQHSPQWQRSPGRRRHRRRPCGRLDLQRLCCHRPQSAHRGQLPLAQPSLRPLSAHRGLLPLPLPFTCRLPRGSSRRRRPSPCHPTVRRPRPGKVQQLGSSGMLAAPAAVAHAHAPCCQAQLSAGRAPSRAPGPPRLACHHQCKQGLVRRRAAALPPGMPSPWILPILAKAVPPRHEEHALPEGLQPWSRMHLPQPVPRLSRPVTQPSRPVALVRPCAGELCCDCCSARSCSPLLAGSAAAGSNGQPLDTPPLCAAAAAAARRPWAGGGVRRLLLHLPGRAQDGCDAAVLALLHVRDVRQGHHGRRQAVPGVPAGDRADCQSQLTCSRRQRLCWLAGHG